MLNFEGSYESLENNYSLIFLDIDKAKIKLENEESSILFKIKILKLIDNSKNNFHCLFSIHLFSNLIITI